MKLDKAMELTQDLVSGGQKVHLEPYTLHNKEEDYLGIRVILNVDYLKSSDFGSIQETEKRCGCKFYLKADTIIYE